MADLSEFWTQLWVSGSTNQCLSCGETAWADHGLTAIPKLNPASGEFEYDEELMAMALVCRSCGFIRMHQLVLLSEEGQNGGNGAAG